MFDEFRDRKLLPVNVVVDTSEEEIEVKDAYGISIATRRPTSM
jgi:hypothetical protein